MKLGLSRKAVVVAEEDEAATAAEDEEGMAAVAIAVAAAVDRVEAADEIVSRRSRACAKAQLVCSLCYFATLLQNPNQLRRRKPLNPDRQIRPRRFAFWARFFARQTPSLPPHHPCIQTSEAKPLAFP